MIYLLKYSDYSQEEQLGDWVAHAKWFQHIEMARIADRFDSDGYTTGEIGCKTNFKNLLRFVKSRTIIVDPYNGAPGGGPTDIPRLPYPIGLFRCLVGPDSHIIPDAFFDITLSISVIEHVGQAEAKYDCNPATVQPAAQEQLRDQFCKELFRMTKPGGYTFHTVDHAARNLSYMANFEGAGFQRINVKAPPTVEECLTDLDAVRQRVDWRNHGQPMPQNEQALHACLLMGFYRPH